ncbi:MAG: glycosyltransferase [Anaerolineae bacterium]|nr:glycosyltransferase [Anaerolineae bacterium]
MKPKDSIKVSIIVPTYNRADLLGEALDSVLKQTFTNWEVIVVDDGSVDDTKALVSKYIDRDSDRHSRIRYIYQANKGLPGARNTGLRAATGDYIAFLDSDDLFLPHKLQSQVAVLDQSPNLGLVASGHVEVDLHLRVLRTTRPWLAYPGLDLTSWLTSCPFIVNAVLVRRRWLEQVDFFDEEMRYVEDWDLWLRLAQAGCPMAWHPDVVCYYRFHISNMARHAQLMQNGMLRLMDKLYAQPDLSPNVLARKEKAYANIYLDTAGRALPQGMGLRAKPGWRAPSS